MNIHIRTRATRTAATVLAVGLVAAALLVAPASASAADSIIAPKSYTTTSGSIAPGGSVAKLQVQDQSGTADVFDRYVELVSTSAVYRGYRTYSVPASVPPATVSSIVVKANYRGAAAAQQRWTWSLYNWSTATWTTVGTNATASSWVWKALTFASPSSAASHVSSSGQVRVRVTSNNRVDNALLDFESITVSSADAPVTVPYTLPPAGGAWDYQIGGPYTPAANVQVVSRDRLVAPVAGKYNICYVNLLQTQPDEPGQSTTNPPLGTTSWWLKNHPNVVLKDASGRPITDPVWDDEVVLDVRTAAQRAELASVQKPWFQKCKDDGFQAIEPDNIDADVRSSGLISHAQVREYLKIVVPYVHSIGLAIGQKNAVGADDANLQWATDGPRFVTDVTPAQGFDFAIAEECGEFQECGTYVDMYGGRTYVVEYDDANFAATCAEGGSQLSVQRRDVEVRPAGTTGYIRSEC